MFNTEVEKATKAADKIRDAQAIVKNLSMVIKPFDGDENKDIKDLHKKISKQLKDFEALLEQPKVQGIFRNQKLLPNILRRASWGLMGYIDAPGLREELAIKKAKEAIDKYVGDIDTFFAGDWAIYQNLIKEKELSFFSAFDK